MDHWPARNVYRPNDEKKGKSRDSAKGKEVADKPRPYPIVEQGAVTAANLVHCRGKLEWNVLAQNDLGRRLRPKGEPTKIFPATYPKSSDASDLSITRKAEQGAQFLRTHYPDVDIASDLIREELTEDARRAGDVKEVDPYSGNKLALVTRNERTRKKQTTFLVFPMGPTGRDLNISQLAHSKRDGITFKPLATNAHTFETPIDQIVAQTEDTHDSTEGIYLAVRIIGSTKIMSLHWRGGYPSVQCVASFSRQESGQRHIVDLTPPSIFGAKDVAILAVNDVGHVYRCSTDARQQTHHLYASDSTSETPNDQFWRIAATTSQDTSLLLSSKTLRMIDFRSQTSHLGILSRQHDKFTSIEGTLVDHLIRAVTTKELLWIDERVPERPVLSYKHGRQYDRTLQTMSMPMSNDALTFLLSSKNDLVTVYDVSRSKDGPIQMQTPAYSVRGMGLSEERFIGNVLFRHPSDTDDKDLLLLRMSEQGNIHRLDLSFSDTDNVDGDRGKTHVWSREVEEMEKAKDAQNYPMSLSERAFSEVNLEPAYQRIFSLEVATPSQDGENVYNTLESMKTFWSNLDAPVENMLTTYDIGFRSGSEPDDPSRADFFTESALNSTRGYRALVQGRIPFNQVAKRAAWHRDINSTVKRFVPAIAATATDTLGQLSRFKVKMDDYRPGPSIRREAQASEQLTLDLALSTDIYAPHPIKSRDSLDSNRSLEDEAFETMSRAAEAMSIGISEPSPVHFGFLRPVFTKENDHYPADKQTHDTKADHPLGVRLLLKEWDIGSDPAGYVYTDPYDTVAMAMGPKEPIRRPPASIPAHPLTQQSQRMPPVVVPAIPAAPPPIASSQPARVPIIARAQSQGDMMLTQPRLHINSQVSHMPSSQDESHAMPITQVLPGPFGGRPSLAKKKVVKKRLGGF